MTSQRNRNTILPPAVLGRSARTAAWLRRAGLMAALTIRDQGPRLRRLLDIAVALVGLVLVSPLLVAVGVAIKLNSVGPMLFRQERIGRSGRRFQLYKFRTMYVGAELRKASLMAVHSKNVDPVRFKMRQDPRITSIGRWLRRYSVDELPQLLNVLLGDMTLIGPRPAIGREVRLYDARALRRLEVEQGLTCLWQVQGRSELTFEQQVGLDISYIDRSSSVDDLKILLQTIPAVITGRGAY